MWDNVFICKFINKIQQKHRKKKKRRKLKVHKTAFKMDNDLSVFFTSINFEILINVKQKQGFTL